jgi:hypothetical protein
MDQNGAKTKILWGKQGSKDLNGINQRSGGLAEKIPETHQTVLANRSKARVSSEKEPRDGPICQGPKDSRG